MSSSVSNGVVQPTHNRLRLNPNSDHKPDNYDDLCDLDLGSAIFSSLERYLPPSVLALTRDEKVKFMRNILDRYLSPEERDRAQRHKQYREQIIAHYQPLHRELFTIQPQTFFVPSFLKAIADNTEESFRSIMAEPTPGVFTFEMFQPRFCDLLLNEVEHFNGWVNDLSLKIMRPNVMNQHGAVLDDFGFETMLDKLMDGFIRPIAKVFYPEVGGATLDSHHGFVVEYGENWDTDIGFHVDDAEVTLNVCLGQQFSGGELFFRGARCERHVNARSQPEEIYDYSHVPGRAVLHRGHHRHGARATTSGHRINMLLWCRSSVYREMKKYQGDFSSWCGQCIQEKNERQSLSVAAARLELLKGQGKSST